MGIYQMGGAEELKVARLKLFLLPEKLLGSVPVWSQVTLEEGGGWQ